MGRALPFFRKSPVVLGLSAAGLVGCGWLEAASGVRGMPSGIPPGLRSVIVEFGPLFLIFAVFLGVYYGWNLKRVGALKALERQFGGRVARFSLFPVWDASVGGYRLRVRLIPESRNSPSYLEAYLFKKSSFVVKVQRETWAHRAGKYLGWLSEVRMQDVEFAKFFVTSDKPVRAQAFLADTEVKPVVLSLFADGFELLTQDAKKIFARKPRFSLERDLSVPAMQEVLRRLQILAAQE
ncbi:MAG: hypothetical protein ACE14U_05855 [Candidatus Velamenicoccus archaeovorus]